MPDFRDQVAEWSMILIRLADVVDLAGDLERTVENGPILLPSKLFFEATGSIRRSDFTMPLGWFMYVAYSPQLLQYHSARHFADDMQCGSAH